MAWKFSKSTPTNRRFLSSNIHPARNDPRVVPPRSSTNFLPFLSGSGESENVRISLAECGSEQPEFAARKTATPKFAQTKSKERKSPCLKFLKVLRKLLSRSFLSKVWDRVPRSLLLPLPKHPAAEFRRVRLLRREIHGALVDRLDLEVYARRTLQLLNRAREHDTAYPLRIVQRFPHAA